MNFIDGDFKIIIFIWLSNGTGSIVWKKHGYKQSKILHEIMNVDTL